MRRREFVVSVIAAGMTAPVMASKAQHDHGGLTGPLSNATVSFGAWPANPEAPYDRMTQLPPPPPPPNAHVVQPNLVTIKAGGTVSYIISGLHQVQVFAPGTTPEDVTAAIVAAGASGTISIGAGLPPVINVATNRVFRGIVNPAAADRVEVVHFPAPGTYLVICGILPHFNEGMLGWVKVLP